MTTIRCQDSVFNASRVGESAPGLARRRRMATQRTGQPVDGWVDDAYIGWAGEWVGQAGQTSVGVCS